jgi:hypothetical protein
MLASLLRIRLLQAIRIIKGIGTTRTVFLFGLFILAVIVVFKQTESIQNSYYILGGLILAIALFQLKRNDRYFLKTFSVYTPGIFLIEYIILTTPFFLIFLYHAKFLLIGILLFSLVLISNLNFQPKKSSINSVFQKWIPNQSFEWKAGLRKSIFLLMPLWLIAIGTSFFIGSIPIAIFIFGLYNLSFYEKAEPLNLVLSYKLNSRDFLLRKFQLQLQLFSAITIPLVILFLVIHPTFWYIPLIEFLFLSTINVYFILAKYAFFRPNDTSPSLTIFGSIGILGIFIPIFLPVIWILSFWFYAKSKVNLNFYLNDFN